MRLFSSLEGFSRRQKFSLLDSLPALSHDLGELEAFKLTIDTSSKTNNDRSVWLTDSLRHISMEFYSAKTRFDSTTLYLWTSDSVFESRTLKDARSILWNIPYGRRVRNWMEVVGVYVARPRFLNFRSEDTSVSVFEKIEGKTIHVVNHGYRDKREAVADPDTSYPATSTEDLQLFTRGDALAIVNPTTRTVTLRVIRVAGNRWDICKVPGKTTHVYRTLLRNLKGPILAYTSPGTTQALIHKRDYVPSLYFWLEPPNLI